MHRSNKVRKLPLIKVINIMNGLQLIKSVIDYRRSPVMKDSFSGAGLFSVFCVSWGSVALFLGLSV